MTLDHGTRLGAFEITASLGAGGMGEVYSARDTRLDRRVAIKVLPTGLADHADLLARFQREAQAISSLNHPNICTLFDVGEEAGTRFLVMELIEGESLADLLSRGPLKLPQVLEYGAQVAEALGAAHQRGIVHRDLKPGNVMITRAGAKLLDFGLASIVPTSPPIESSTQMATEAAPLTEKGTILGTFQYMAPEQLEGLEADARTDIFSFGALLYEMVTGQRAFPASSRASLIAAIVSSQPTPVSQVTQLAPPALDHVVLKCLEKEPDDRWQSARDVASQLRWIGEAESPATASTSVTGRRATRAWLPWGLAAVLGALLIASTLLGGFTAPPPPPSVHLSIPNRTALYTRTAGGGVISPDGRNVAFWAKRPEERWSLAIRELATGATSLLPTAGMEWVCWSPDGREILLREGSRLRALEVAGGAFRDVTDATTGSIIGAAWGPDDVVLFALEGEGIYRVSALGGVAEKIVSPDPSRFEVSPSFPHFLPDGKRFLYMVTTREPGRTRNVAKLRAGTLDSTRTELVGDIGSKFALLGSGHLVHVADGTLMATRFDPVSLELSGRPSPIAQDLDYFMPTGGASFSAAGNGTIVYSKKVIDESLAWYDASGTEHEVLVERGEFKGLQISPDGEQAAIAVIDPRTGIADIWLYGLNRSTASRLTIDPNAEEYPIWMPDGRSIVHSSDRHRPPDIFVRTLDGAGEETLLIGTEEVEFANDVSPDGRFLLYGTGSDETGRDIWILEMGAPESVRPFITQPEAQLHSRFSPDGRLVSYGSRETGRREIWIRPFPGPGRATQVSIDGASSMVARWARTGRTLYYAHHGGLYAVDLSTAERLRSPEARHLFDTGRTIEDFDVAPKGRFLLVLRDDSIAEPINVIVNWSPAEP